MTQKTKKLILIIGLISIVACGCPGCLLFSNGSTGLVRWLETGEHQQNFSLEMIVGILSWGWMVCLGFILVLIPVVLIIMNLVFKRKKGSLEEIEPTGISKDEPLPPTS